jgi:hypothetical protein
MYDALAERMANIKALAGCSPISLPMTIAIHAFNTGIIIAKGGRKNPALFKSPILFAAKSPMSNRKKLSMPLNMSLVNGFSVSHPSSPEMIPISRLPVIRSTEPFKKASLKTSPQEKEEYRRV